jgi:hypothetical protein
MGKTNKSPLAIDHQNCNIEVRIKEGRVYSAEITPEGEIEYSESSVEFDYSYLPEVEVYCFTHQIEIDSWAGLGPADNL